MIHKLEYQKIEQLLTANILKTKSNLRVAVAWFTNPNLFAILLQLLEKDVTVELILSDDQINFINTKIDFDSFIALNGKLFVSNQPNLMHNKFCIIDNKYLINGSYNWTVKAEKINFENVVLTDNLNLITDFKSYFDHLKNNTSQVVKVNLIKTSSTISKKEMDIELELLSKVEKLDYEVIPDTTNLEYPEELTDAIDEAEMLYLDSKHDECIDYCNKMLKIYKNIPEFYYKKSCAFWRLNKTKEQIENAKKAIELDNEFYDAYNLLGMGYAKIGKEQLSIQNYNNCISNEPEAYVYYRNRAISFFDLQNVPNLTEPIRNNYKKKEKADLEKILEIINGIDPNDLIYPDLSTKSFADFYLGNIKNAKEEIELAIEKYNLVTDKFLKDKNLFKDMKDLQRDIKNHKK